MRRVLWSDDVYLRQHDEIVAPTPAIISIGW
jgi:hypothetical protein